MKTGNIEQDSISHMDENMLCLVQHRGLQGQHRGLRDQGEWHHIGASHLTPVPRPKARLHPGRHGTHCAGGQSPSGSAPVRQGSHVTYCGDIHLRSLGTTYAGLLIILIRGVQGASCLNTASTPDLHRNKQTPPLKTHLTENPRRTARKTDTSTVRCTEYAAASFEPPLGIIKERGLQIASERDRIPMEPRTASNCHISGCVAGHHLGK